MQASTSGQWQRGLALALTTMLCWATLPVILKLSLRELDTLTLTWFRLAFSFVASALILLPRHGLAPWRRLGRRSLALLAAASALLTANYVFYLMGLDRTSPGNAQVLIQLAPMLMALGGLWLFGERYDRVQWAGFTSLLAGLALFSGGKLQISTASSYVAGSLLVVAAAVVWAGYALAQKALQRALGAQQVMIVIYAVGTVALAPVAVPERLLHLSTVGLAAVLFCALNTVVAYGAFAESMRHWEASRISAILALAPLGTLATGMIAHGLDPERFPADPVGPMGWMGAVLVVAGSVASSLARRPPVHEEAPTPRPAEAA